LYMKLVQQQERVKVAQLRTSNRATHLGTHPLILELFEHALNHQDIIIIIYFDYHE
jgi:hypothetical protein